MGSKTRKRKVYAIKLKLETCEYAEKSSNEKTAKYSRLCRKSLILQYDIILIEAESPKWTSRGQKGMLGASIRSFKVLS